MKKTLVLLALIGLIICSGTVTASDQMVIVFDDGKTQTVNLIKPSSNIRSINFNGVQTQTGAKPGNLIKVTAGTYGRNCGAPHGNKTDHLAKTCNNKSQCEYTIDYRVIGDPAVGCGKDYRAEWKCGTDSTVHKASASPEAGFRKKVTLSCPK